MGESPLLRIQLLGSLALSWEGRPLALPSSATARSLLAYLVTYRDRPHPRDLLAGTFWPDRPDAAARKALSNALWQIRQALDPAADRLAVEGDTVTLALHPGDWLDVEVLARELERCRERPAGAPATLRPEELTDLESAAALYQGDLVEECYDDWALLEREHLREGYLWLLEQLITCYKQWENHERALVLAQRLVAADPLREAAHAELMRLYHLLGRHRAALAQYESLGQVLQEVGAEPAAATIALRDQIAASLHEPGVPHLPAAAVPPLLRDPTLLPFIGRTAERAALLEALQAAGQGQGGVALVAGPAGVGKTRLLQQVVGDARWRGWQIGPAKADTLAAAAPYQLLHEALQPLLTPLRLAQLAGLVEPVWFSAIAVLWPAIAAHLPDLPPLAPLDPPQAQQRLWEGLVQCLAGLAAIAPLLLVLEDVQWADRATLAALPYLAPRLPAQRTLLLLSCRAAEAREQPGVWSALEALDRVQPLRRVELTPLAPAETAALVLQALGTTGEDRPAAAFAQAVQERTAGNALFAVELLRALLEQGALAAQSVGGWTFPPAADPLPTPPSLGELVGQWLQRLPSAERGTLELTAVLGEDAGFSLLAAAGSAAPAALTTALAKLWQKGFLAETATGYRFAHDLVRETTYRAIPPQRRRTLHRAALRVLEPAAGGRVEVLAHHAAGGGEWAAAARYYQAAGERAAALGANASAAAAYGQALAALEWLPGPADLARRFELLLAREQMYDRLGERQAQQQDWQSLANLADLLDDDHRRAEAALRRANWANVVSDYPACIDAAQAAIRLAQAAQDDALAARGYLQWGKALLGQTAREAARAQLEQALARSQATRSRQPEAESLRGLGTVCWYLGDYDGAQSYYEQSLQICRAIADRQGECNNLGNLGSIALLRGSHAEAQARYQEALRVSREVGDRSAECSILNNVGLIPHTQGDYAQAQSYQAQALRIAGEIGNRHIEARALNSLAGIAFELADYPQGFDLQEQVLRLFQEIGDRRNEAFALAQLGRLHTFLGNDIPALSYSRQAVQVAQEIGERHMEGLAWNSLGTSLAAQGHFAEAAAAFRSALAIRQDLGQRTLALEPLSGLAHVYSAWGDLPQAQVYVEELLGELGDTELDYTIEDYLVYLNCYRVLRAGRHPRADEFLSASYRLLQKKASCIPDGANRRAFLENAPINREIRALYEDYECRSSGRPIPCRLPRAGAPTGRPLRDDEYVAVTWTVEAPDDHQIGPKTARRRHRLRRLLREAAEQGGAPTVNDLAAALAASPATIKRDLAALRRAGHAVQTRGATEDTAK